MRQKTVTFYVLADSFLGEYGSAFTLHEQVAFSQLVQLFAQKRKIYLHCDSQLQAEKFDEALWQHPIERFIPHALKGEGEKSFVPVLIGWGDLTSSNHAEVSINLQQTNPIVLQNRTQIIDFVPTDELLKASARVRYRFYKQQGFELQTLSFQGLS